MASSNQFASNSNNVPTGHVSNSLDSAPVQKNQLTVCSYNLHGFNQGCHGIIELIDHYSPNILLLQEHWLTPNNLHYFDRFHNYFSFGSSAMSEAVASGILYGRPYGGVMCLVSNNLRSSTQLIHSADRFVIIKIDNYVIVNLYLPCAGTENRCLLYQDVFNEIWSYCEQYSASCTFIIGGDFNVNLDKNDNLSIFVKSFMHIHGLFRCDDLFPLSKGDTYLNAALHNSNLIDFILTSSPGDAVDFVVLELDINFSDHRPIIAKFNHHLDNSNANGSEDFASLQPKQSVTQFRWDHADKVGYYYFTGDHLQNLLSVIDNYVPTDMNDFRHFIDFCYDKTVDILNISTNHFVPKCKKNFFKFWWDQELDILKQESIQSNQIWKAAGKPRSGSVFNKHQESRSRYRKRIRDRQRLETQSYTNSLHDSLITKNGAAFWKCWRSKFEKGGDCVEVGGSRDPRIILDSFVKHFSSVCAPNDAEKATKLRADYLNHRSNYHGLPLTVVDNFDADLVSTCILNMKSGKAPGLDGLTVEHFVNCHPVVNSILCKLFNLMLKCKYVPVGFCYSYTVPLPKLDCHSNALAANDFRGISINCVISKVFENCILKRFAKFFETKDNQFGFKKSLGCSHAIYSVRSIIENHLRGGSTVNICSLDLSKAFDKADHHALFSKLLKRLIPSCLVDTLYYWTTNCFTSVKWLNQYSDVFRVSSGVRQGSVLSPALFAIYIDDIVNIDNRFSVIIYADDILLITTSITRLQSLFTACEVELYDLNMTLNSSKTCCIRIGPRCKVKCADIVTFSGQHIPWCSKIKYLGITFVSSVRLKCCFDVAKRKYYRAVNAIFSKVGRLASEDVVLHLISSKCIPILLYASEACPISKADIRSLDFAVNRFLFKLFKTNNINIVNDCRFFFGFRLPSELIKIRVEKFKMTLRDNTNAICRIFCDVALDS